ncbi:Retrovirus-related Pol polyprotein from transposon TNT 1-94 [Gossypium australe]|uniref:Retrovirus-related Pol polyprotein from transposon TNT 1-94 n=1 Tax=Gossypium australe TaxID=47621 RepID=A0A5B6VY67_9ROSI|nr:Retrovirus-related Pol polyprotein from transposon TNT 1-94 [Gossypium australe]
METQSGCNICKHRASFDYTYTSQKNGVVERKNRKIIEMARCFLHDKGLLKNFWAEAANITYGYKPEFVNLKAFGCVCFSYIHQVMRDKLDKKAYARTSRAYISSLKAYRIYLPDRNKIEFHEEDDDIDDEPVRGTRSLSDIYQMCNVFVMEPARYEEAADTDQNYKNAIGVKWVYRTKLNPNVSVNKYKPRLVANGYAQMFGVEFLETFALVARMDTVRMLYCPRKRREGVSIEKALYWLKNRYSRIDAYLLNLGFEKYLSEFTLYIKKNGDELLVVSPYVDDLLVLGSRLEFIDKFKEEMKEYKKKQTEIFVCQQKYAKEVINKFSIEACKSTATLMNQKDNCSKEDAAEKINDNLYRSLNGCLMYLTTTRLHIMHVVSLLSRHSYGIKFSQVENFNLHDYSDSNWVGCAGDMRSTSSYCFSLGSVIFSWCLKKQEIVVQSTAEAEYVVATASQALWIRKLLTDFHIEQEENTQIFEDNQATVSIANNLVFHGRTKHFKIKFYFLHDVQ